MPKLENVRSADGTSIAFERRGDGDPVVVLVEPPLHHRAFSAFGGLVPLLAKALTVITYDRRGRGHSGDTPPYHPDREIEDLHAVIRAAGGVAGIYGYSAGALLALRTAGSPAAGATVVGLVLLEPPVHDDSDPRPDPLTVEITELVATDRAAAVRRFHQAIGVPEEYLDEMASSPSWDRMIETAHTLVYDCTISDSTDSGVLARVVAPSLVLDSEGSTNDLTGWAATVADQLPNATSRSLQGEWHTVPDDLLAPVIIDHLRAAAGLHRR